MTSKPRTLYEKIWDAHVVDRRDDGTCLIYIDRHLTHEVTSPQAFEGLRVAGRKVRRPDLTLAVPDHNLPTTPRLAADGTRLPIADVESAQQLAALEQNVADFGVPYIDANAPEQGIVHVVGPEQGFSQPGTTIVCGDSHTACHGGIGALAFGIGTSEVEHVLATQTLLLSQSKTMEVRVEGKLGFGVSPKDVILAIIGRDRHFAGGTGYAHRICRRGRSRQVGRWKAVMTDLATCRSKAAHVPAWLRRTRSTYEYPEGQTEGAEGPRTGIKCDGVTGRRCRSDPTARIFDKEIRDHRRRRELPPLVTWGTSPEDVVSITGVCAQSGRASPIRRSQEACQSKSLRSNISG